MTTTDQPSNALAVRKPLSLADLARRIDLNKASGWGLQNANQNQLNALALYCQKLGLLPGDEATLYEGKPWITVDGAVTLMRRNRDEYRGHAQRPLTIQEKEGWGWEADDIVVETTVRTATCGEIKAYGRVSAAERNGVAVQGVRHNPVARHHAVEMAMKRSLRRAQRFAFGTENFVDDEELAEAVSSVIEERNNPERVALNAATYDRVWGADEDGTAFADAPAPQPQTTETMVKSVQHGRYQVLSERIEQVALAGGDPADYGVKLPVALSLVDEKIAAAEKFIESRVDAADSESEPF